MKITPIGTRMPYMAKQNNYSTNNIAFGFGQDYGDDDYLVANNYEHKEGGNVFTYFKLLGQFFYALIKENVFGDYSMAAKNYNDNEISDDNTDITQTPEFDDEDMTL